MTVLPSEMNAKDANQFWESLQHDIDAVIQDAITILQLADKVIGNENEEFSEGIETLKSEAEKMLRMQLTLPVIAPMKAGKSTLINAIAGVNILPSRNTAMTTLPTAIILGEFDEPTLILHKDLLEIISQDS